MSDEPFDSNQKEEMAMNDDDWENRTLCSDESCIGVIGPDGRCKECGKLNEESQPAESDEPQGVAEPDNDIAESEPAQADNDWENRTLCSDGSCIGVIGPNGRCKECGKPYKG
jgi:hypothetical protein